MLSLFDYKLKFCIIAVPHRKVCVPYIIIKIKIQILSARVCIIVIEPSAEGCNKRRISAFYLIFAVANAVIGGTNQRTSYYILRLNPMIQLINLPLFVKALEFEPYCVRKSELALIEPFYLIAVIGLFNPKIRNPYLSDSSPSKPNR